MHTLLTASLLALTFPAAQDAPGGEAAAPEGPKRLTLEQAAGRDRSAPSYSTRAERFSWADDGVHVVVGRGDEAKWMNPETGELVDPPAPLAQDPAEDPAEEPPAEGPPATDAAASERASDDDVFKALLAIDGVDEARAKLATGPGRTRASVVGENGETRLMLHDDELFFFGRDAAGADRVGRVPAAEGPFELLDLSPDGRYAGWVQDNDLRVLDTVSGELVAVTENGSDEYFNGKLDWVYQEEVYGRGDFKAFWFADDGAHVAFLALDESAVYEFTVVDHIEDGTFRVKPEIVNYPKAGDPNPTTKLGIARSDDGATVWADLSGYEGEILVVRVGWAPDGRCLAMIQDRIQTWCDLVEVDLESGALKPLLKETSTTWVERPAWPRFLADGTFLWQSERTGYNHVYHYRADGTLVRPVTAGEWTVRRLMEVDEDAGTLLFASTQDGAIDTHVYRVGLDGTGLARLTQGRGSHSLDFRPDGAYFLDRVSSLESPEEVRLCAADGTVVKVLDTATIPAEDAGWPVARWEVHEIAARDGTLLDVALLKPVPFDPAKTYPVWLPTYSGPDAPSVRNRWSGSAWDQFLAQQGVIVLQVNVRTASNKGMWAIGQCYKRLGVQELADLEDAVDWLTANPWADAARVGITGYSYGGFMSAYALLASKKFALGVAGGGVYDWAMYDTIYTERYMSTPQLNPEGYAGTSCLNKAENLHGFLHLYHGVMDDNVHFQNMLQLGYALQKAGQQNWSMMAYPQNRHGIRDRDQAWHAKQMEWALIVEHLRPPGHAESGASAATVGAGAGG